MQIYDQQIDELISKHEGSWQRGYNKFPAVLKKLGLKRGAEIGVAFGGHSEAILEHAGIEKLYAVDSYLHRPEYDDPMNLPQPVFDRLYQRTGERLAAFGNRCQQVRLDSVDAAAAIDDTLDFVYIDGDHSYEGIRADLAAWLPKIRVGGILAGHDYGQPAFPGVRAVVDAFFDRFGIEVHHEGAGVWWAMRPATHAALVIPSSKATQNEADAQRIVQALEQAGMTADDTVMLVGPEPCSKALELQLHGRYRWQCIDTATSVGPWRAMSLAVQQTTLPLAMPIDAERLPEAGSLELLRMLAATTGARAASLFGMQPTEDFDLRAFLRSSKCPIQPSQTVLFTRAWRGAMKAMPLMPAISDRARGWCLLMQILAEGGRIALTPNAQQTTHNAWSGDECRAAAHAMCRHAELLTAVDLLRLNRRESASQWLNELDEKPVRLLEHVRPADQPVVYITPNLLDRVVHKIRRGIKQVA